MNNQLTVVFNNFVGVTCRLSVLIPVRNDFRVNRLLEVLALQARDDMQVCIINDLKPDPIITALPSPLKGTILHSDSDITLGEKLATLLERSQGEWVVYVESDTIPHKNWVEDMMNLIEEAAPGAVHQGGEIFAKSRNLNNFFFKRGLKVPRYERGLYWAQDTVWFMACENAGIPIIRHDLEAVLFHDARVSEGDMRFFKYAIDYAYLAAQDGQFELLKRRLLAEGYYLTRGLTGVLSMPPLYVYFYIKKLIGRFI